jgi:hypothetical protein
MMGHPSGQALYFFSTSPCAPPLVSIKGEEGNGHKHYTSYGLNTTLRDLGPTPSPDQFVTPTTNTPSSGTRQLDTRRKGITPQRPELV